MPTQLADGVWRLDLGVVNAALVDDDGALTLVDAGTPGGVETILDGIAETGHAPADLDRILVTHYDVDHVGGLSAFDDQDVPIYAGDAKLVRGARRPSPMGVKGAFQRLVGWRLTPPDNEVVPADDGRRVGGFRAYATPGHTPGHVAFVHEGRSVGLLGDLVRTDGDGFVVPPWYVNDDTARVRESIQALAAEVPTFDVAIVGHGPPIGANASEQFRSFADDLGE